MLGHPETTLSSDNLLPIIEMTQAQVANKLLLMVEEPKHKAFGDRVAARMTALGMSVAVIQTATGVTYEMARRYSLGIAFPRQAKLELLAKALQVDPSWLAYGTADTRNKPRAQYEIGAIEPWDNSTPLAEEDIELPFFKECEFAAGCGATHTIELNGRKLRFALSTLRAAGVDPSNAACGTSSGNSMAPYIPDGATVGIDLSKTQIIDGETYAIDHNGLFRIKYVYRLPGGGLRFRSENAAEHPDESYAAIEVKERIRILGWVWWISNIKRWKGAR